MGVMPDSRHGHLFTSLTELYPSAAYVDWTCLDSYDWDANPAGPEAGTHSGSFTTPRTT